MSWRAINALAAVTLITLVAALVLHWPVYGDLFAPGQHSDFKWPRAVAAANGAMDIRLAFLVRVYNREVAVWAAVLYAAAFAGWYLWLGAERPAKVTVALLAALDFAQRPLAPRLSDEQKAALLNIAVKAFFIPLMTVFLVGNAANVLNALGNTLAHRHLALFEWYWLHLYWALFWGLLAVDTFWFWLGYLVEHARLGNTIRSVEPTLLGWVVTLACYPALNAWMAKLLGWYASDQPQVLMHFGQSDAARWTMFALGVVVLALMTVYAWASVAMGLKASNLTNRGTVSHGPYRWARHPAYAAKNAAWVVSGLVPLAATLSSVPWAALAAAVGRADSGALLSLLAGARAPIAQAGLIAVSLAGWSFIYHLRAVTEERHLRRDREYRDYCSRVKWRYLPGLY